MLQAFGYTLARMTALLIQILPKSLLYGFSTFVFLIWYGIIRYRKKEVEQNIRNSFPGKTEKEIRWTARKFHRHFCDLAFEIIKIQDLKPDKYDKYVRFVNLEGLEDIHKRNQSVFALAGHVGNWEFMNIFPRKVRVKSLAVYLPFKNRYYDGYVKRVRERLGAEIVPQEKFVRTILSYENKKKPTATLILADQSPSLDSIDRWIEFLNQRTACDLGAERVAKKINAAVFYLDIQKVRRGFYEYRFLPICENAADTENGYVTEEFYRLLEKNIRRQPAYWLWSHRRWKHKQAR